MRYRDRLLHYRNIFDAQGSETLFLNAMREITAYHLLHNAEYTNLVRRQGFRLGSLHTFNDLHRIPPLPTLFLKKHTLFTVPQNRMIIKATTSGTSGHKSTVGLDLNTGIYALEMVLRVLSHRKMLSPLPTNYIMLGYQPSRHNQAGIVKTAFGFTLLTFTLHREYALKDTGTSYELNLDGLINALQRYEKQGFPVRLVGLPAYHHLLLTTLRDAGIRLKLHPKSLLCMGGGWKQFYFEHADKEELYDLAGQVLGIPATNCIDIYGAVEHPIVYCDCPNHHFHVPVYSRVIIRDVDTLQPVPYGQAGILNLLSPMLRAMPLHSIMTDDLAILHKGSECGCGNPAPYFELLGRAGLQDIKTCAAGAASFLNAIPPQKEG